MRDFLWESFGEGESMHLVKWETVRKSRKKKIDVLGIGNVVNRNHAS